MTIGLRKSSSKSMLSILTPQPQFQNSSQKPQPGLVPSHQDSSQQQQLQSHSLCLLDDEAASFCHLDKSTCTETRNCKGNFNYKDCEVDVDVHGEVDVDVDGDVDNHSIASSSFASSWNHEPIVVGYAFGPKKMKSMGVIMAEASRVPVIHEDKEEDLLYLSACSGSECESICTSSNTCPRVFTAAGRAKKAVCDNPSSYPYPCSSEDVPNRTSTRNYVNNGNTMSCSLLENEFFSDCDQLLQQKQRHYHHHRQQQQQEQVQQLHQHQNNQQKIKEDASSFKHLPFSYTSSPTSLKRMATPSSTSFRLTRAALEDLEPHSLFVTLGSSNETDLKNVVRYFRSSCSSAASMTETTESTPTTATGTGTVTTLNSSSNRRYHNRSPVRISFVPLDPDLPLEEQHGGHFDLILHKLTEDILTCSLEDVDTNVDTNVDDASHANIKEVDHLMSSDRVFSKDGMVSKEASYRRVRSLNRYQQLINPSCCLLDNPKNVQTLMSRSGIAKVLHNCLQGVQSTSGIPVKAPKFVVVEYSNIRNPLDEAAKVKHLQEQLHAQGLRPPLIVKPLVAAGTKESHYMTIVLGETALAKVPSRSIMQAYVNHNAILYKVYVLGKHVYVYQRPSLPNIPSAQELLDTAMVDWLEFDSQRPYPSLQDFGIRVAGAVQGQEDVCTDTTNINESSSASSFGDTPSVTEVRPIVESLRKAFGLELFGFDILLSADRNEWHVVDVNYFPSYKEVPNFPSKLAHFLTERVLEQRRRTQQEQEQGAEHSLRAARPSSEEYE